MDRAASAAPTVSQKEFDFPARRTIFRQNASVDDVPIICDGWAAAALSLSNGRRQILSFLLPGEIAAPRLILDSKLHVSIDTITEGCYRTFDRGELRAVMSSSPEIFDRILAACSAENERSDQLIATLGQRTAHERVAWLLVDLWDRLERSHKIEDDRVDFPLRQSHIADATGLTAVYVGKVLSEFRNEYMVDISDRMLQIADIERLRQLVA